MPLQGRPQPRAYPAALRREPPPGRKPLATYRLNHRSGS